MAVTTVKSPQIIALETTQNLGPRMINDTKTKQAQIEVATTSLDDVGDKILLIALPSHAIPTSIRLRNDDLDSSTGLAVDLRVFYSGIGGNQAINGHNNGDVISGSAIATAITTLQAANNTSTELIFEASDINSASNELWQLATLTSDCGGYLYLGFFVTTVATTPVAGTITIYVEYI
jgi:hypothetical protein